MVIAQLLNGSKWDDPPSDHHPRVDPRGTGDLKFSPAARAKRRSPQATAVSASTA